MMASSSSTSSRSQKRKKRRHNDSDEDCSDDSNFSTSSRNSQELNQSIPRKTSDWKPYILDKLHLRWDHQIRSPEDLLNVCRIPPLTDELIGIADYITEIINIDFSIDQLKAMSMVDLRAIGQQLGDIKSNLQEHALSGSESDFKVNIHTHGQVFVEAVKKLIYFLSVEETSYESLFVPVLREFCKVCSFLGCDGEVKRERIVEGCAVVAFPDLTFQAVKLPFTLQGYVSVSEIKTCDSSIEQGKLDSSKLLPWEINGTAQHAGQLLLEAKQSAFKPYSFGLIFTGSQIIMTCLKVSAYYLNHVADKLKDDDEGKLYYSDSFDIFVAEDRKVLVKAFLRLAQAQRIQQDIL